MQRLEVSGAVRLIYGSLGVKGLRMVFVFRRDPHQIEGSPTSLSTSVMPLQDLLQVE